MGVTKVSIDLEILDKAASKVLDDFSKKADKADKSLEKMSFSGKAAFKEIGVHIGEATGLFDIFTGNVLANLAIKGFELLADAAKELFNVFVVEGVHAAQEEQQAIQDLNVALAQNGHFTEETTKHVEDYAASMQQLTGVQDDVIVKNAALLENLTGLDGKGLTRATSAALDLSAALGKDLATTIEIVGKAANGNVTPLEKLGITVQKGATDAQTFENALKQLEGRFGGTAEKQVNTFAGSVNLLKANFTDFQEAIGNVIVKNNVVVAVFGAVSSILKELSTNVKANEQVLKEFVGGGIIVTIQALEFLLSTLDVVGKIFNTVVAGLATPFKNLATVIEAISQVAQGNFTQAATTLKDGFIGAFTDIGQALTGDTVFVKIGNGLADVQGAAEQGFGALKEGASTSVDPVNNLAGGFTKLTDEQKKANEETQKWAVALANANAGGKAELDAQLQIVNSNRETLLLAAQDDATAQVAIQQDAIAQKQALEDQYYADQQTRLENARNNNLITETQYLQASTTLDSQSKEKQTKNETDLTKIKQQEQKRQAEDRKSSLSYISSLQQESSKELFFIGKAAALAVAYIDGQAAVMKALSAAPPPFNFVLAALVGVAAAANLGRIAGAQPPSFEQGGIVPGSSFTGDKVQANVNSGEMILNRSQQSKLFNMANSGTGGDKLDAAISLLTEVLNQPIIVNMDSKQLFNIIRNQQNGGRSFA